MASKPSNGSINRSALTDHAVQENHVINWADASVIDRESDRSVRWIKEAIHIRTEGQRPMNCEEGSYQLSHAYNCFLGTPATYCAKNLEEELIFHSSDEEFQWKPKCKRYINFLLVQMNFNKH